MSPPRHTRQRTQNDPFSPWRFPSCWICSLVAPASIRSATLGGSGKHVSGLRLTTPGSCRATMRRPVTWTRQRVGRTGDCWDAGPRTHPKHEPEETDECHERLRVNREAASLGNGALRIHGGYNSFSGANQKEDEQEDHRTAAGRLTALGRMVRAWHGRKGGDVRPRH